MPEYAALLHHHNLANEDGEESPPSANDVSAMFLRMERAGIGKIH